MKRSNRDNLDSRCKDCVKILSKESHLRNIDKVKEYGKKYREENKDHINARVDAWQKANPDRIKATGSAWQKANAEKVCAKSKAWQARNPDKVNTPETKAKCKIWRSNNKHIRNALEAKRKAAKLQATPSWANEFFISEAYSLAHLRTKLTGISWQVDHQVPLQSPKVCGLHVHNNLQVITAKENASKQNRFWPEM